MLWFYILLFLVSCVCLAVSSKWLVRTLMNIAKFLGWREFVVTFFTIAFAASLPNLFVGISAALQKIPQLSFGDVIGGNVIDMTLAVALAVFISRSSISAKSRMVQASTFFTVAVAVLPLILVLDGILSRGDGLILILAFVFYIFWLFSKQERFVKIYNHQKPRGFKSFLKDLFGLFLAIFLLLAASQGIVRSAVFFSQTVNAPLILIGSVVVALGNALPEMYFGIVSAKKEQNWMVLGDLMGSVIGCATFVLGIVALICPIQIDNLPTVILSRFFLIFAAFCFFLFIRTDKKITKKEGLFLFFVYLAFVILTLLIR